MYLFLLDSQWVITIPGPIFKIIIQINYIFNIINYIFFKLNNFSAFYLYCLYLVLFIRASRGHWLNLNQSCSYTTRKSAEERLGIEKPKRPLTPFFKFMTQMRPALLAKNPGITSKEAIAWSSKHWQELDAEVLLSNLLFLFNLLF